MNKVKILQVFKEDRTWYFGGYAVGNEITYAHTPLKAMTFPVNLEWHEEVQLNKATDYLEENGFTYRELILEYQIYPKGEIK